MTGLTPLLRLWSEAVRRVRLAGWKWARAELPYTLGVTHPDMNRVVLRIAELEPAPKRRSRCEELPGMCAADEACPDLNCPARTWGMPRA